MKRFVKTVNGKQIRNISLPHEGAGDREILINLMIYSNKLTYLHLITVLVYGNSYEQKVMNNIT